MTIPIRALHGSDIIRKYIFFLSKFPDIRRIFSEMDTHTIKAKLNSKEYSLQRNSNDRLKSKIWESMYLVEDTILNQLNDSRMIDYSDELKNVETNNKCTI